MDKEGLRLEIELLEGKVKGSSTVFDAPESVINVLLTIHSKEINTHINSFIKSNYPLWNIKHANDALEAYAKLEQEPADILICELCMPYLTGYGLIKKLNANARLKQIPTILISPEPIEGIINSEMTWLSDPFNHEELKKMLNMILHRPRT